MMATAATAFTAAPSPTHAASPVPGWLALLQEATESDSSILQQRALEALAGLVDTHWSEMASVLPDLEALPAAAGIASRVWYYLGEPASALRVAVTAGVDWNSSAASPYATCLTQTALDAYMDLRKRQDEDTEMKADDDDDDHGLSLEQLEPLVRNCLTAACAAGAYRPALGVCLAAEWSEPLATVLEEAIAKKNDTAILTYAWEQVQRASGKVFRQQAAQVIVGLLEAQSKDSSISQLQVTIYQWLQEPAKVAQVLQQQNPQTLALQLAFDMHDSGDYVFCKAVAEALPSGDAEDTTQPSTPLYQILAQGFVHDAQLSFLHKQNHADRSVVEWIKQKLEERSSSTARSLLHNATVVAHSYVYAGTTNDAFLRDNLDWMKKASNWCVSR